MSSFEKSETILAPAKVELLQEQCGFRAAVASSTWQITAMPSMVRLSASQCPSKTNRSENFGRDLPLVFLARVLLRSSILAFPSPALPTSTAFLSARRRVM